MYASTKSSSWLKFPNDQAIADSAQRKNLALMRTQLMSFVTDLLRFIL